MSRVRYNEQAHMYKCSIKRTNNKIRNRVLIIKLQIFISDQITAGTQLSLVTVIHQ